MNIILSLKALRDLGPEQVSLNLLYRLALRLDLFRTSPKLITDNYSLITDHFAIPSREEILSVLGSEGQRQLLHDANEIAAGRVRLFGGEAVDLRLTPPTPLHNWVDYETGRAREEGDIKFTWEPARFGWATVLARAYYISGREKYAETFWLTFETFQQTNPPHQGPNWTSGQEVALRLIAWTFCLPLLRGADATTEARVRALGEAIAVHAVRIPSTLIYARSQNNNHLLSEAAGLITAASVLPEHPHARRWMRLGKKWLNRGLEKQIDGYGEYSQHSTNYHRVMLQLALWVNTLNTKGTKGHNGFIFSPLARKNLARASHWLASMLDSESGGVPNLGANDGAYILPLTVCPFADFRPVVQASARAFLDYELPGGVWDEMSLWFGLTRSGRTFEAGHYLGDHLRGRESWAMLRTTSFTSRPGHADLLHLDLWWRGLNITRDPGTFSYNAAAPWDNPLTAAQYHNTVTVDGRDQMTRAGKFLYVDWANAFAKTEVVVDEAVLQRVRAHHNGYRALGVKHEREVTVFADESWRVHDILSVSKKDDWHAYTLHWSLPDWKWELAELPDELLDNGRTGFDLKLKSPNGWVTVRVHYDYFAPDVQLGGRRVQLVRAGEYLAGAVSLIGDDFPIHLFGWHSPAYAVKEPALSLLVTIKSPIDPDFVTEFIFPK